MEENNQLNLQNQEQAGQENLQEPAKNVGYDEEHKIDITGSFENMEPNMIAALSYLVPPVTGVIFFIIEKKNKFVRFHAFQSILFGFVSWGLMSIAGTIYVIGPIINSILRVIVILLWLFLMWKAYNKEEYELPILGKIAKDQLPKES